MTHVHHPDVEVVDGGGDASMFSGFMLAIVALLIVAVIAFAVLWTRPWDSSSSGSNNNVPSIGDNSGQPGGGSGGDQSGGGTSGGGTSGGGQSGGSGGGQPQPAQ